MTKKELQVRVIKLERELTQIKMDCQSKSFEIEHLTQIIGQLYLDRRTARERCQHYKDQLVNDDLPF